jgi:hypothetical protein
VPPAVRERSRARRRAARAVAAIIVSAGVVLAASACGGSRGGATQAGSPTSPPQTALAFSRCMRSHGVASYPDPGSGGNLQKVGVQQLGVTSSELRSAQTACQHLLPTTDVEASVTQCLSTGDCPGALLHRILNEGLSFAHCMRAHGTPGWPDPTRAPGNGAPEFDLMQAHGFDPSSPQIAARMDACQHVYSAGVRVGLERP